MKNIEYGQMAEVYDFLYKNKKYEHEVEFLNLFIPNKSAQILDAGCGTGTHSKILYDLGYINLSGFDLNEDMLKVARTKLSTPLKCDNLLTFCENTKYDVIISMFAVFNHLKNYKEFKQALLNLKSALKPNGIIIIDLHNPLKSGEKIETFGNVTRIMKWKKCKLLQKEFSKITYIIENKKLKACHIFKIYNINKLNKIALDLGFTSVKFYENYNKNTFATSNSKNIQMVLK